jgi:hypothetical protein
MNSNSVLKSLIEEFLPYAKEKLGIKKPIEIILKTDKQNAKDPLGKTAYYDPQNGSITLYPGNSYKINNTNCKIFHISEDNIFHTG